MAIKGVDPKCYILALFVREDGERFLLGSGRYVFKEKQQHFQANKMANDVIEVQGNDGYLLAGQVRRPGTQDFDGYVGDGTSSKEQVEQWRRDFFKFFRKNYLYKVIYVFSDGSAIQRKRGFLVDAPTVEELYQIYPEYHVALNFEDINYYFYNEDSDGNEIYGKSAIIGLTVGATGGLMWDNLGAISLPYSWLNPVSVSGTDIQINNQLSDEVPITDLQLAGDTFQQTYSGKNLLGLNDYTGNYGSSSYTGFGNILQIQSAYGIAVALVVGGGNFKYTRTSGYDSNQRWKFTGLTPNTDYTISCEYTFTLASTQSVFLFDVYRSKNNNSLTQKFTTDTNGEIVFSTMFYGMAQNDVAQLTNIQVEQGSTATSYEPYTGSTPSQLVPAPNPDYPQDIQVVTGEQTVTVTGKNLFDKNAATTGKRLGPDGGEIDDIPYFTSNFIPVNPSNAYKFSGYTQEGGLSALAQYDSNKNFIKRVSGYGWFNVSLEQNTAYIKFCTLLTDIDTTQLELGSTATTYEPYQGATKTVDLGSIELAKIGTYQDYIYKSGDDWYIHKEIGKSVVTGSESETWTTADSQNTGDTFYAGCRNIDSDGPIETGKDNLISDYFRQISNIWGGDDVGSQIIPSQNWYKLRFRVLKTDLATVDLAGMKAWFAAHNTTVYYILATPTDTQITDATLIGELDGLEGTKLFIGENNVLVTANGSNLPATLSFKYYTGINYDGAGFEWEAGGSGGDDMITVDSIDDVYPMLTIPGPVVNPTITNVTTGSVFQYTGTLSSTQTLEVDLMAKTAFLNGVSVIANVTSSSLYFKSGMNRVSYTTNNADAPDATIKWQEIVG